MGRAFSRSAVRISGVLRTQPETAGSADGKDRQRPRNSLRRQGFIELSSTMTDDKNERAAKGELLTHGERQLKGQPRENQPAMVIDSP
jgi:hypothetical protein